MEDRELLVLAAKALGGKFSPGNTKHRTGETWDEWEWIGPLGISVGGQTIYPHLNDGHGACMEAALEIYIVWWPDRTEAVHIAQDGSRFSASFSHVCAGGKQAARRLASLRVAAEIGKRVS